MKSEAAHAPPPRPPWARTLKSLWGVGIVFTLFVILFGAWVRISGSGAGCGQHWPTCHGEVVHLPQSVETVIEMTHRVTSGLLMLFSLLLLVLTYRWREKSHLARRGAAWSFFFMMLEAAVGAGLVLLELVGLNDSPARAGIMALHLVNTSLLLLCMISAWQNAARASSETVWLSISTLQRAAFVGASLLVFVSAAGAVTALGDTVFPVQESHGVGEAALALTQGDSHFLEQMRGFHPILACLGAAGLIWIASTPAFSHYRNLLIAIVISQVAAGILNIFLSAPGWMQVMHLALANALWIVWVLAWIAIADTQRVAAATSTWEKR